MTTFNSMAEEVNLNLAGFTLRQDKQTHVTNETGLSSSGLELTVGNADSISTGLIEIDDELIYVDSFSQADKSLSIAPYGRGYAGTTASSHAKNSRIVMAPTFPRVNIKRAINDTINSLFPSVYAVASTTFQYKPAVSTYPLPSGAETVLSVSYESTGSTKEWVPVRNYRIDAMSNVGKFNSPNTITIYGGVESGRTVQVFYTTQPDVMEAGDDDFEMTTGLPASCKDLVILGAQWRLVSTIDQARLTFGSAESDQQSQVAGRAYGSGTNTAKFLLALYDKRLQEEANKLNDRHPIRIHRTLR